MATSPFLIFSKSQNFFNCKSIANLNRRPVLQAHSPSKRFYTSSSSNSFASSTSAFSSSPSSFFQNRSASPTRVNVYGSSPSASNIRFSLDNRQIYSSPSISVILRSNNSNQVSKKQLDKSRRMCMCSPTSHPGWLYDPGIPELETFLHKGLFFPSNKFTNAFHEDYVGKLFDEMPGDDFWFELKAIRCTCSLELHGFARNILWSTWHVSHLLGMLERCEQKQSCFPNIGSKLLVAQSCEELAGFVRLEIRDSLILSIVQQLIEDSAIVVREAAARNLALLLPLYPNMDKYIKVSISLSLTKYDSRGYHGQTKLSDLTGFPFPTVDEMMFHLVCDPSGAVVDTTIKELVHVVLKWDNKLDHNLRVLISNMLSSVKSDFHVLGEREQWIVDVLLWLLMQLLPIVHQIAIDTCSYPSFSEFTETIFFTSIASKIFRWTLRLAYI
ncbi:hypothetical protein Lser_V15G04160 [Lactuca serriola]